MRGHVAVHDAYVNRHVLCYLLGLELGLVDAVDDRVQHGVEYSFDDTIWLGVPDADQFPILVGDLLCFILGNVDAKLFRLDIRLQHGITVRFFNPDVLGDVECELIRVVDAVAVRLFDPDELGVIDAVGVAVELANKHGIVLRVFLAVGQWVVDADELGDIDCDDL